MIVFDPKDVTPLGVLSLSITTIVAPVVGWLVRNGSRLVKRTTLIEARFKERMKDLDSLQVAHTANDTRITRVEDAIVEMRSAAQRSDEQFATIMNELKQLPRVTALLETFHAAMSQVVPRSEVDARLRNAEERLKLVEGDIRRTL